MAKAKVKEKEEVIIVGEEATPVVEEKANDNEEVILVSEETKAKIDAIKNEEEVIVEKQEEKPVIKNVKIVLKEDHRCNVGGNWYRFTAGKQYIVPENVKDILRGADLLAPL